MGLLYQLETEMEREIPVRLQASLQAALDAYRAHCADCDLAMHRHHRYHRSIMTGYGTGRWSCRYRCSGVVTADA